MKITSIPQSQITFKSIILDAKDRQKSDVLLEEYSMADTERFEDVVKTELYELYDPYFRREAVSKIISKFTPYRQDYVQKLHVSLFDSCNKLSEDGALTTDNLLDKLNGVKVEKADLRVHCCKDFQAFDKTGYKDYIYSYEESIPESMAYTYPSTPNDGERELVKEKVESLLDKTSGLSDCEKDILDMRSDGLSYSKIASESALSFSTVRQYALSGIAKIQQENGVLPKVYEDYAVALKNKYNLKQEVSEIVDAFVPLSKFITKDINEIYSKIDTTASLLNLKPSEYADMLVRRFELLAYPPETIKKKVDDIANLLGSTPERMAVLFRRKPVMLTNSVDLYKKRLSEAPKVLGMTPEEFLTIVKKDISLMGYSPENLKDNLDNSSKAIGVSIDVFKSMVKQMPELLYQKPEHLKSKITDGAELLGISFEEYRKMCVGRPAVLIYSPKTIQRKIRDIAKMYGVTFEQTVNLAKSQPVLLVKKLDTLKRNFEQGPEAYGVTPEKFLEMSMKNPAFLVRDPSTIAHKVAIADYYKKVRNQQDGQVSIRTSKDDVLYQNILMYLVRKEDNPKLLNAKNFVSYINQNSSKVYSFKIPADKRVASDFVEFVKDYSQKNFNRQVFDLEIVEDYN